jgi:hypothetical protein
MIKADRINNLIEVTVLVIWGLIKKSPKKKMNRGIRAIIRLVDF